MTQTDHEVSKVLAFMRPQRSGRIIFTGKGDEPLLKLRDQIKREQDSRQDVFETEPDYVPGLSFSNGSR